MFCICDQSRVLMRFKTKDNFRGCLTNTVIKCNERVDVGFLQWSLKGVIEILFCVMYSIKSSLDSVSRMNNFSGLWNNKTSGCALFNSHMHSTMYRFKCWQQQDNVANVSQTVYVISIHFRLNLKADHDVCEGWIDCFKWICLYLLHFQKGVAAPESALRDLKMLSFNRWWR